MLFNSFEYLIFLPIIFIIYWSLNSNFKAQNLILLIASYIFYAYWDYRFLSLILYSSIVDFIVGLKLSSSKSNNSRKILLVTSLISNLGLLFIFKYFNFFIDSFEDLMNVFGWKVNTLTLQIILPVGISFYTFQTLSYTIDIYRKQIVPTSSIIGFLTYVSFFPQLVAGPIERASNLLPQIESRRELTVSKFKDGIFQIIIGLFRKIVIADNLGIYVDHVYGDVGLFNSSSLLIATVFYAFQIYFDFAGYSDIAIGSAKLFGFNFQRNFSTPYFSKSLTEFWRKWHISLSSWLKDYLYISLGGNRLGKILTYRNLMITMLLGGLWHGSSWNFVVWGAIHGAFLSIEKIIFGKLKIRNFNSLGTIYTFFVVLIAWVFFRSKSFNESVMILKSILNFKMELPDINNINTMGIAIVMLLFGLVFDLFLAVSNEKLETIGAKLPVFIYYSLISICIILIVLFYSTSENFIYFQF